MRTTNLTLLILGLMAAPAIASYPGPGNGGGGGPKPGKFGTLRVTNECDAAVRVGSDHTGFQLTLEPFASGNLPVDVKGGKAQDVTIGVSLVADPAVSTSRVCTVQANRVTPVTVSCSTTASGVSLTIVCGEPQKQASLGTSHESNVALASGGGLGFLLLLGTLLGRAPRRRIETQEMKFKSETPEPHSCRPLLLGRCRVPILPLTLLLLTLLAAPAMAMQTTTFFRLQVSNKCDDAVSVSVGGQTVILEPQASHEFVLAPGRASTVAERKTVTVYSELVSDPSVSAEKSVTIKASETKKVRIGCRTRKGKTTISIASNQPGIGVNRDANVMIASTGGLGFLLLLGTLFGRCSRRREPSMAAEFDTCDSVPKESDDA